MNQASPRAPSRRTLLASTGALSLAWLLAHGAGHWPVSRGAGGALGASAMATLRSVLDALLPEGTDVEAIAADIDAFLADSEPWQAEDLSSALLVLEHTAGVGPLAFRSFSRQARADRIEAIEAWMTSSIALRRQIASAMRRTAVFSYYARPETWPSIGYDGPWVGRGAL